MGANTLLTSVITGGTNSHTTTAEEANALATDFVTQGVVGAITLNSGSGGTGSFCVNADGTPDMGITIKAGQAYITATPSSQNSQVLRVRASADYTAYTINANSSGSTKYDWIYLSVSAFNANNPAADGSNVASFVTSRSSSNTTDNGTPPTYGLLLAIVTVANGASSITNGNITDKRFNTSIGAQNGSLIVTQPATGQDAIVQATGSDANINIDMVAKGSTGNVNLKPGSNGYVQKNGNRIDWWEELGRTTLNSSASSVTVSFTAKKYLHIRIFEIQSGLCAALLRFNSDSSSNYAWRRAVNGATDSSATSASSIDMGGDTSQTSEVIADIVNISSSEKIVRYTRDITGAFGASSANNRVEGSGKWVNTSSQITSVTWVTTSNSFASGTEVVVLGHD